ncbi:hypothetical protein GBA52_018591 [Prunus armeniaca]|nr:hypothetical protein GBA52_018591 [Prunus armeniaca]
MPPPGPGGPPGFGCLGALCSVLMFCVAAACLRAAVDPCLVGDLAVLVGPVVVLVDPVVADPVVVDLVGPVAFEYELAAAAAAACDLLHNVEFQVQYIHMHDVITSERYWHVAAVLATCNSIFSLF